MYLAELPWRRGCTVIRGAQRGLFSFLSVFFNKAPFIWPHSHWLEATTVMRLFHQYFVPKICFFGPNAWGPVKIPLHDNLMILYSILVYILPFTQAHIPVCLDGTIIDSSTILVTICITVVMLGYDWWLCMVLINIISVQYSGGLLPDFILLTQGYYQWGTRLNTM